MKGPMRNPFYLGLVARKPVIVAQLTAMNYIGVLISNMINITSESNSVWHEQFYHHAALSTTFSNAGNANSLTFL